MDCAVEQIVEFESPCEKLKAENNEMRQKVKETTRKRDLILDCLLQVVDEECESPSSADSNSESSEEDFDFEPDSDIEYKKSPKKSKKEQNRKAAQRYRMKNAKEAKKIQKKYEELKAENDLIRQKIKSMATKRNVFLDCLYEDKIIDKKFCVVPC